jgi:hypothetical protein
MDGFISPTRLNISYYPAMIQYDEKVNRHLIGLGRPNPVKKQSPIGYDFFLNKRVDDIRKEVGDYLFIQLSDILQVMKSVYFTFVGDERISSILDKDKLIKDMTAETIKKLKYMLQARQVGQRNALYLKKKTPIRPRLTRENYENITDKTIYR